MVFIIEETYLHLMAERMIRSGVRHTCTEKRSYQSVSAVIAKIHLEAV